MKEDTSVASGSSAIPARTERLTASRLRQDVYRILDGVLATGIPVEIERRGKVLQITAMDAPSRLAGLARRAYLAVDPEELVHLDWSAEWSPEPTAAASAPRTPNPPGR